MGRSPKQTKDGERLVIRNLTYRLYPTKKQEQTLERWLEMHRRLYNMCLAQRQDAWKRLRRSIYYLEQQNQLPPLKEEWPELAELGSNASQETIRRVDRAFQGFFRRLQEYRTLPPYQKKTKKGGALFPKRKKPGYPRFKGMNRMDSFCYPSPSNWKIVEGGVAITNLGHIKMRGGCRVPMSEGEPRTLTVRRHAGRWYAIFGVRYPFSALQRKAPEEPRPVGIDTGVRDLLVTSDDDDHIPNPKYTAQYEAKLISLDRALSRKRRGSKNRKRAAVARARAYDKLTRVRKYYLHRVSTDLVRQYTLIAADDLHLQKLSKSARGTQENPGKEVKKQAKFNRYLLDASIGRLYQYLAYKAEEAGGRFVLVNAWHTTEDCSSCDASVPKPLSARNHTCPRCGLDTDRKHNAARTILALGLQSQTGCTPPEVPSSAPREGQGAEAQTSCSVEQG